jgi:hypothetical protein
MAKSADLPGEKTWAKSVIEQCTVLCADEEGKPENWVLALTMDWHLLGTL